MNLLPPPAGKTVVLALFGSSVKWCHISENLMAQSQASQETHVHEYACLWLVNTRRASFTGNRADQEIQINRRETDQRFLIYEDGQSLIGATMWRNGLQSYKRTPKWELASDPNLATPHYTSCLLMLDPARVCQGQRNVDNKVDFLLIYLSDKSIFYI